MNRLSPVVGVKSKQRFNVLSIRHGLFTSLKGRTNVESPIPRFAFINPNLFIDSSRFIFIVNGWSYITKINNSIVSAISVNMVNLVDRICTIYNFPYNAMSEIRFAHYSNGNPAFCVVRIGNLSSTSSIPLSGGVDSSVSSAIAEHAGRSLFPSEKPGRWVVIKQIIKQLLGWERGRLHGTYSLKLSALSSLNFHQAQIKEGSLDA